MDTTSSSAASIAAPTAAERLAAPTAAERLAAPTAAERLAAYRSAAAALAPRASISEPERSVAEIFGKAAADSRNFFTNVAAVYKVERDLGRM